MKHNYDNMDEFFKKQLLDESPDLDWNVPSMDIFEISISKLPKPKVKKRRLFIWYLLGTLVFISFLLFEVKRTKNINDLSNKIENLNTIFYKNNIANNSVGENDQDRDANSPLNKITKENTSHALSFKYRTKYSTYKINDAVTKKSELIGNSYKFELMDDVVSRQNQFTELGFLFNKFNSAFKNLDSTDNSQSVAFISPLEKLDVKYNEVLTSENRNYIKLNSEISVIDYNAHHSNKPISLGIAYSQIFSWFTMNNVPVNMRECLTKYDNRQVSFGINTHVQKEIHKRLSAKITLGYNKYINESEFNSEILYDGKYTTIMNNGDKIYQPKLSIMNPMGDYVTISNIKLSQPMVQNENISEKVIISQVIHAAAIGIGAEFNILNLSKFKFSVGSGLQSNIVLSSENKFKINLNSSKINHDFVDRIDKIKGQNSHFYSINGEINLSYIMKNNWSIYFSSGTAKSISSIRNSNPTSGPQTYLHSINLGIGSKYKF